MSKNLYRRRGNGLWMAFLCLIMVGVFAACDVQKQIDDLQPDEQEEEEEEEKVTSLAFYTVLDYDADNIWVKNVKIAGKTLNVSDEADCDSQLGWGRLELDESVLSQSSLSYTIIYNIGASEYSATGKISTSSIQEGQCNPVEVISSGGSLALKIHGASNPGGNNGNPDDNEDPDDNENPGNTDGDGSYMIYGLVWAEASEDCNEGSGIFDDAAAYYYKVINGKYSSTVYKTESDKMKAEMKADFPNARTYFVESSYFMSNKSTHAVFITYKKKHSGWDCRSRIIAVGVGTSEQAALESAIKKKNNNAGSSTPYEIIDKVSW